MVLRLLSALVLLAATASAQEVQRYVFAIVPGKEPDIHLENQVHTLLECPLNYLGMLVRHHYIESGPPPAGALDDAAAVLTFFESDTPEPDWLWEFLEQTVARRKLKVIHFGDFGPLARSPKRLGKWLARFGLEWQEVFIRGPYGVGVELLDPKLCAYEADPRMRVIHAGPKSVASDNRTWVTTRELDVENGSVCHPVVTGPWGALALDPWTLRKGGEAPDRRWHLDPFAFLKEALDLDRIPAPHPAVLNGRRIWFLQVDGDGFESLSTIRQGAYAARVLKEEVLEKYQLPFTVSVVIRSLTTDYRVKEATKKMLLAREILALENVEPASHGVLHPIEWQPERVRDAGGVPPMWYRSMENYDYSAVAEVRDSIRFINERLTRSPRHCVLMLWTGQANPREEAIQAATDAGCLNLNGGIFRWDRWHDSVGYVSPWSRRAGKALQVYAGAPNENNFDGFFDTMPGSYRHVDETIRRTGSPRILKPANLYIHFYSAEKAARLQPTHELIQRWTVDEPTTPVFASTYVRAVVSAVETARIVRRPTGWSLRGFGECRSVRIDGESRVVDFTRSKGVLGARRVGARLWIHLAASDAEVVLTRDPPRRPHVEEANCILEEAALGGRGVSVTAVAHNPRVVVFRGFPPDRAVQVQLDDVVRPAHSDREGRVAVRLPEPGKTRITVALDD
ncbi:MAG: polysaccharide deacetylase family protein [Planctomycetota bacterium]